MTFYNFMMRYKHGDGAKRDLAWDMYDDKEHFPRKGSDGHKILREYLENQNACDDCLATFEKCWSEYVLCEKARLNKNS